MFCKYTQSPNPIKIHTPTSFRMLTANFRGAGRQLHNMTKAKPSTMCIVVARGISCPFLPPDDADPCPLESLLLTAAGIVVVCVMDEIPELALELEFIVAAFNDEAVCRGCNLLESCCCVCWITCCCGANLWPAVLEQDLEFRVLLLLLLVPLLLSAFFQTVRNANSIRNPLSSR